MHKHVKAVFEDTICKTMGQINLEIKFFTQTGSDIKPSSDSSKSPCCCPFFLNVQEEFRFFRPH